MKLPLLSRTESGVKKTRETWFGKIARLFERDQVGDDVWLELEELLILADVGVETTGKLIRKVKQRSREVKASGGREVKALLKEEMVRMLTLDHQESVPEAARRVILVVGVNGSGKTTSIAKLARSLNKDGIPVILAAADTFRAAAIDQLKTWGERIGVTVVANQPGGDPGAVVFDAIQAARARQVPVVIVDTAGRLHTKFNLMEELKKIRRVIDKAEANVQVEVLLVMDATTGQNGLTQAKSFTEAVGISGAILSKLDGTARGGIVLAICDQIRIPIVYIGTGEGVDDLAPFDATTFVEAILG